MSKGIHEAVRLLSNNFKVDGLTRALTRQHSFSQENIAKHSKNIEKHSKTQQNIQKHSKNIAKTQENIGKHSNTQQNIAKHSKTQEKHSKNIAKRSKTQEKHSKSIAKHSNTYIPFCFPILSGEGSYQVKSSFPGGASFFENVFLVVFNQFAGYNFEENSQ